MDVRFPHSPAEVAKVELVQFGVLSPDEIRQMSVAQIEYAETMENGKPKAGGLSDPRMGTVDRKIKCQTCMTGMAECPGHFGHLELAKLMFHIGFIKTDNTKFKQALKIRNPKKRLKRIYDACKTKKVYGEGDDLNVQQQQDTDEHIKRRGGCGAQQPIITIDGIKMLVEFKAPNKKNDDREQLSESVEPKQIVSADRVLNVLKRISDEDCLLLGLHPKLARPDWMILQVLPNPPPPVRPSIMMGTSSKSEDDLTHQLAMIIQHNENLRRQERNGAPAHIIAEFAQLLQFHVATYFNNELPGQPWATQLSGRPIKSICSRLKAKEGRVRGNLMGKRVDFSARIVITPDPNINTDELGVPWSIALNLTYPETVTPYNIERLKELVLNGPHPPLGKTGAKEFLYYFCSSGLWFPQVERHLNDGDFVLFNRQSSLHKMSIMGHRIKIMPYSTFWLNLSITSPYNADFDGDEMNMHVPQSFDTRAEVLELMMVPKCIVSPQPNKPVMGIVQDTLLGCRKITKRDTLIEKDVFMNILMWWEDFDGKIPAPAILKPRPIRTGKQVFNLIIPRQINLIWFCSWHSDEEKGFATPSDREEVGLDAASKFLGYTQWLVNYWLLQNGFSIGIGDMIADAATMENINYTNCTTKDGVKELIKQARDKQFEATPGRTMMESFENKVNEILKTARDDAGSSAQKSLSQSNNLKAMVTAGSKGTFINISQMAACVGQQNIEGKRIPFGFTDRTLPHFMKDDYGPKSHGFVENSYLQGLTPQEFFFHAMGGREGLIDTAVKTSETGYIQQRLVKAMEDIMVKYDGTNVQKTFKIDIRTRSDMHPIEIVEAIDKLQERLKVVSGDGAISIEAQKNAILFFNIHLRATFASKRVLREYMLTREAFEWIIDEIVLRFSQSLVAPSEMIGCVATQSIGEPATQMTMNIFHFAGVSAKNVTLGVPRLREIINVAKKIKTPSLSVYLKPEVNKKKELAKSVQCALEYTTLRSVTHATEVWYDPDLMGTIIEEDLEFVQSYYEMPDEDIDLDKISPWLLRIELNREMMVDKKLSMADITDKINHEFDDELSCIFSDDNADKLILHLRIRNDEASRGEIQDEPAEDEVFHKKIESNMLIEMSLQGILDINKVFIKEWKVNKFDVNDGFKEHEEWMLDTEGVNLLAVMCHEDVDATRTTSNHLIEVIEVLGIEAVRRALLDELQAVISFDGSYVNYRHLAILCDTMTYRGHLMAITRHGINRNDTGALMRCSFEETVDILLDASVHAESNYLRGVTENIMLGQLAPIGTGDRALFLNDQML
ncbi:unnamed protein product [Miscanthus lutarioriparius]|uniref:DNA-directed RNA polymerase subunit n=1 Tax=Miscanthus lutarioriparius TaxID=422564 RepID=A0A811QW28_9POAL|nr:unnamed protein product [Miscanthus lutarioriparius]